MSKAEKWRRKALWKNVEQFNHLTKFPVTSQIVSIILENEESTLSASKLFLFPHVNFISILKAIPFSFFVLPLINIFIQVPYEMRISRDCHQTTFGASKFMQVVVDMLPTYRLFRLKLIFKI